ncbi:MAG: ROK family transcriptional regulator [Rikenellaceae bacterium]|nr:ROK family transcriptional regulator [Rikenellaceae bacterium]
MPNIKYYLNNIPKDSVKGVEYKNIIIKKNIITFFTQNRRSTIASLAQELKMSIPSITKLINEMISEGIIIDSGKIATNGGRRPNIYGLAESSIYFIGINVSKRHISFVLTGLSNEIIDIKRNIPFQLKNTDECLEDLCSQINKYVAELDIDSDKIMGVGMTLSGRVNSKSGYSYYYFNNTEKPLSQILEEKTGFTFLIENETRSSCYAEYLNGREKGVKNLLYFYLSHGLAVGIIVDGKLYYGKSGFAGEFGHSPFFNNGIICQCGKKGCLETEISGQALERTMINKINEGNTTMLSESYKEKQTLSLTDIIVAAKKEDVLSIELIEEMARKAGKSIATLINMFNPEQLIIGGTIAAAGDYFMLPMISAVNKYSLSLVNKDTEFSLSQLGEDGEVLGVAMLIKEKILGN